MLPPVATSLTLVTKFMRPSTTGSASAPNIMKHTKKQAIQPPQGMDEVLPEGESFRPTLNRIKKRKWQVTKMSKLMKNAVEKPWSSNVGNTSRSDTTSHAESTTKTAANTTPGRALM